jgi:hypothetical protein
VISEASDVMSLGLPLTTWCCRALVLDGVGVDGVEVQGYEGEEDVGDGDVCH